MTNTFSDRNETAPRRFVDDVRGTGSAYVMGAALSSDSERVQTAVEYGGLPMGFADNRHNQPQGEPVY